MDSEQPKESSMASRVSASAPSTTRFEYFLYVAIIVETALAALVYKAIFRNPNLARMSAYFAVFYFAFLAWAIAQLNVLHRDRHPKPAQAEEPPLADSAPEPRENAHEDTRPRFGLTTPQLVILAVVFATAVATFSCALRFLR
jgi:hypothetical protein